jgi:alpha-galactosidase
MRTTSGDAYSLEHYSPQPGGEKVTVPLAAATWGAQPEANHLARIQFYVDHELPMECYWIDAGWSGKTGPFESWWENAGNRVVNRDYFPNGLKPISDAAHEHGMKFLLWHWPNRAIPGLEVTVEHPEWYYPAGEGIDQGNPEVNAWVIEDNCKRIADFGIDIYRQDGDPIYPPDEDPDRQGINQCNHVKGFYEFWDTMLERFPNLMIDNCAGGGRKIDLETIMRSVCLWRSDFQCDDPFDPIGMQGQTYGLSFWAPLSSGCARLADPYNFRSAYSPGIVTGLIPDFKDPAEIAKTFDFDRARNEINLYLELRECFYGDYYPLTSYSAAADVWMVWQFNRPDLGRGLFQAFRRPESGYETARFKLRGLVADTDYEVTDVDEKTPCIVTGDELMTNGLHITIPEKPGVAVVTYKRSK